MPNTAAFIDDLRLAFGKDAVDKCIRRGMKGEPGWFHAREQGQSVGTVFPVEPYLPMNEMLVETEPRRTKR